VADKKTKVVDLNKTTTAQVYVHVKEQTIEKVEGENFRDKHLKLQNFWDRNYNRRAMDTFIDTLMQNPSGLREDFKAFMREALEIEKKPKNEAITK